MAENKNYPIVAIVPSLNPDENLLHTVDAILNIGFSDIILVDDGSKKECQNYFNILAQKQGVSVIHHKENKGKGAALKTAFKYYLTNYNQSIYKGVVTADADGQHLAQDIYNTAEKMLKETNSFDRILVLGTRDFDDPIVPFKSKNGNKITTIIFQMFYGKRINDTQTGLRAISNTYVSECLELKGDRFEYEILMLIDAVLSKVMISEVKIETVYLNQNRETHFNPIKDSFKIYKVMLGNFVKFSCTGLLSMALDQGLFAIFVNLLFGFLKAENGIVISTVLARVCSSLFNYLMNRTVVFKSKSGISSLIRYYALCVIQMLASAGGVVLAYHLTKGNPSVLKLLVDLLLFFISYQIQQRWVFAGEER